MVRGVGVLAVQGDFEAHGRALARLGLEAREVRTPGDLEGLDALVLPGGESGAHLRILKENGLFEALRSFHARGGALFGTCAGMILLAKGVSGPFQDSLGLIDVDVERNAYGRQIDSFEADADAGEIGLPSVRMVFIRAPRVTRVGPGARVLLRHDGEPVAVSQGRVLVSAFHPEMSDDSRLHAFFLDHVATRAEGEAGQSSSASEPPHPGRRLPMDEPLPGDVSFDH